MAYNKSQKLQDNIAAIKLVLQLSKEGRTANDDERAVLRRYSGFGGLKFILNPAASDEDKRHWKISDQQYFRPVRELYAIIHEYASDDNEERAIVDSVKRSVNTAFYTPGAVIDAIASVFKERGVKVRTMLDPSAGIGKFGDSFKQAYDGDIKVSAFEKDVLTGKILSALNPNDQVTVDGFETIPAKMQGSFDLATSNIPFGDIRVMDDEYRRSKNDAKRYSVSTIHNYFFLKALDQVREGGFVAFITSRGFMDSPSNNPIRQEIAKNARLVGAFRLPDGMFRDEAGTDVGSDLVVLQKISGYDMSLDPETQDFCETSKGFKAMSGEDYTDITMNTFWWQSMMTPDAEVSVSTNMMRGTDPYGKPTLVFTHDGGMDGISKQLKEYFSRDLHREYIDYYQEHAPKIEAAVVEQQPEQQAQRPVEDIAVSQQKPLEQQQQPQGRPQGRSRGQAQQQAQSAPVQLDLFAMWDELDAGNGPSQEEVQAQEAERAAQEAARREAERKRLEPRAWVGDYKEWYRDGTVVVEPNTHHVGVLTGNTFTPLANLTADQTGRLRQYVLIRDAYHELYNTEAELREEQPDLREVLNRHYDNFFLQYGRLNERRNARVIMMDALGRDGLTLENEGENRDFVKADIFERPVSFISYEITHVDNPEEALSASLNRYGRVNLEYMAGLTGNKQEEIPGLLKGQIYYMPDGSYEIASKALSGNVYEKLEYVSEALDMIKGQEPGDDIDASIIPALEETKAALQAVIPEQIAFDDIGLQFGERWIPTEYYEEYIGKLFNTKMEIHYAEHIDEYSLKAEDRWNLKIREEFCVRGEYKDYDGMALLAHAFHNTTPDIQKCIGYDENGDDLKGPDMEKIQLANTKIEEIRDGFTEYLTNLPKEKRDELQEMYNRKFNCFVKAKYDGSYQTFPGIDLKALASPKFNIKNIYKSQKDCVKMILENGGGICDHEVGTGKSLIMCMAAHEMHRLGIANKPMIIAMKANVAEIAATYQAAFPDDKILYASEKDFSPANRVQFFSRIKNNDYACVIMSHDQFGKIPQAMEVQQQILQDEIRDIDEALDVIRQQGGNISGRMLTGLEKRKENMEVKLMELQSDMANRKDDFVDFGRMGIDHIFIDESHQFKNLMFTTRHQRVSGLGNPSGSQKALNLLYAIRTIQNRTGKDLGATFLSGTTISNSLTELYLLFKYLRPEAMAKQGIHSFDAWAAVYAKKTSDYEFSVTNAVVQKERFRYFVKVPELATFYNEITDYRTGEDVGLDRPNMNVILHDIEPTADQKDFNERLVQFAQTGDGELIFRAPLSDREMKGKMLIATDASRKASMDMRLVSQELFGDDPNNKASHCARLVSEYYQKFNEQKGAQFIFSDLSTYKPNEWNIFQEIKDKLVNDYGIPASEIRFIQEASSNKVKQKMIDLMNEGKIRVLFGSTSTLGTGVNAQQRAVAVHHIDIPWRPSDLEQRNGRARRTGNWVAKEFAGNNVDIIIYAVKRTLDSYKFNLLQNKQLFITQLKTNQLGTRVIDEGAMDEENGMNFAEYVAILSGNDDLLQKAKLEKKIMALESERKTYMQARRDTEWRLENAREKLGKNEVIINGMTEDYERYQSQVKQGEDGTPLPGLVMNNVSEFTADGAYNIEEMGAALQDAGRTVGNKDRQMGTVYGFPLMVDTIYMYDEKLRKEVYAGNKFYVKGNYLYEHNNGKLAMSKDNRLGAVRYGVNALEKIPGVIAQYQERNEKLRADIAEYERIAGKPWGKEDELKGLKKEMEALDAKIRESLDETTKNMPKVEEKPYKFSKEGRYHKVLFARDAYPFVSISEMREFADTGSWRNRGYVRCGNWDGDVMVSEPEVEGEFTLRQKAEEFIAKVEETNNERKNNLDWLIVKAKENTKGDKVHQDNEVIFAAREALQKKGVDWQNAQEPAKGAVPTQEEIEIERLLVLANTQNALSNDLWLRARKVLDERGIDWRTGLSLNDVNQYVLKWSNTRDNELTLYAQGILSRARVFHPGDAAHLTDQEKKQLASYVDAARGPFYDNMERRDAYERLMIYTDYLGDKLFRREDVSEVHPFEGDGLIPGAEFYQQYISEHYQTYSHESVVKVSNQLFALTEQYTKLPDWNSRDSVLAQMRVQANRILRANGFGGAKDIVELMMNHVMPQDQQRDLDKMRVYSAGQYGGTVMGEELRTIAHQVKEYGTDSSVRAVVDKMIGIFNNIPNEDLKKMVLIPMPGASGYPGYMENVVNELGERTGLQTANSLFSTEHEPLYDLKMNGTAYELLPDIKFEMDGTLPAGTIVVLVDNVLDTGKTLSQAAKADFGEGVEVRAAVLAHTDNYQEHNPQIEVRTIPQLREELSVLRDQRKAEREAGYEAAIAALEVSQQGVDAAAVEEMKRLLTISWKSPFGGKDAKEQLNALGVDWKTGETIVANAADRVSFQYVPKNYVSTISDAEKSMMSQVASDLMTGNHLLGRRRPDGYRELMAEIGGAFAAVKTLSLTARQRDLLVALSGQYHEGYAELASQADVSEDVLKEALSRVDGMRHGVVTQIMPQPYHIYHEDDAFVLDYEHGFGLAGNLVEQVAKVHGGEIFERAGRKMVLFDSERSMQGFIDNIRTLNVSYTNDLRDALVARLRAAGISVNTDWQEGERVLQQENGNFRMMAQERIEFLEKTEKFIEESLKGKHRGQRIEVQIPLETRRKIRKAMGRDFDSHNIYANGIIHSKTNHGIDGEKLGSDSIPLSDEDFKLAPHIMVAPDRVVPGSMGTDGRESIRFEKDLSNGIVLVVEKEQKNSPNDMDTITMWATVSSLGADARYMRPLHNTSQPVDVANGADAPEVANTRTVIQSFDIAKIRKDSEEAIIRDEYLKKFNKNVSEHRVTGFSVDEIKEKVGTRLTNNNYTKVRSINPFVNLLQGQPMFFRSGEHQAYGFVHNGTIYIDSRIATAETPLHEYTHLWAEVLRQRNPQEWQNIVQMMKDTPDVWNYVKQNYPHLKTDDQIADEALAQFSGKRGYKKLQEFVDGKQDADTIMGKMMEALAKFWNHVAEFFGIHYTNKEEVADRILYDLLNEVNPLDYKLKNVEGIRENQESQIESDNFKKWFGDWHKPSIYRAYMVDDVAGLKDRYPSELPNKFYAHSTVTYGLQAMDDREGQQKWMHIIGRLTTDKVDVLVVDNPESNNKYAHITLATAEGVKPVESNAELEKHAAEIVPLDDYVDVTFKNVLNRNLSKVVDADGKPLAVEHGTHADFTVFDISRIGSNSKDNGLFGAGFYFGTHAPGWLNDGSEDYRNMKVFLDIKHPFEVNDKASLDIYSEIVKKMDSPAMRGLTITGLNGKQMLVGEYIDVIKAVDDVIKHNPVHVNGQIAHDEELQSYHPKDRQRIWREHEISRLTGMGTLGMSWQVVIAEQIGSVQFTEAAKADGYDGVIVDRGEDYKEYVAFEPTQIKSASYNIGLFSKENSDIRFQFIGQKGATNLDVALDGGMYISNLRHAEKLEKVGRSPLDIKIETGWERGADGQWRLELPSFREFDAAANLEWLRRHPDTARYLELLRKDNAHHFGGFAPLTAEERAEYERLRELPDNKYWMPGVTMKNPDRLTLEDYVSSPLLFMAYPELRHVVMRVEEMEDRGAYATRKSVVDGSDIHYIRLNKDMVEGARGLNVSSRHQMKSTIAHEVQHYIQEQEGFARGNDIRRINGASDFELNVAAWDGFVQQEVGQEPTYDMIMSYLKDEQLSDWRKEFGPGYQDMMKNLIRMSENMDADTFMKNYEYFRDNGLKGAAWTQYWESMGEVESRNVQARMGMSMEQRRHTLAVDTEDVPRDRQTANYTSVIAASREVSERPVEPRKLTVQDREAGGALVDHLQSMGITVHTDNRENRRILKAAEKDQSEAGKVRHFKTETGESYGFAYKGEIHLDLRKLDAELPLHEFAHLFCQAMQRINPDNWNHVVGLLKQDAETWDAVKRIYPELATDSEVAEEVIAQYSGKRGAEKLQAELERMTPRDANYGSRWGNIYQNVAKAIQDFWKHIGDSVNIEYSSKEDIADQILNDFAKNVNPVKKMERWLEERDKEYAVAVERGDTDKARELFNAAMQEHVGNGVTPFIAVDGYRGKMDRLARAVKSDGLNSVNLNAINEAADLMAPMVPDNAVLVPAPSHEGYATDMLLLANAIGVRTNSEVADVLKSAPRDSQYDHKINTGKPFTAEELGIHMEGELPEGKFPVVIDNVVNTGNTAEACVQALGGGLVLSLASATSQERHVASLKSASPIVYDKQGQLIPLSERFELKNKWLGRVMNYKPLDGAVKQPVVKEPDVIQGLEGYSVEDVKSFVENSIDEILEDAGLSDDITIKNITVVGSRSRGEAHEGSDLDILVEYEGDFREDALFDILHEEALDLEGITIDINPINPHYSLTTEQWLARDAQWREEDRQKAAVKSDENENVQSKNIRSMQTSVIKSNLQVLADRLLPGTQSRVRFLKPQDPDRPSAVGGEIYRREDGIHVFRENQDVPLSSIDDRNELTDLYRSLLEYSIAERIGNGNGMNFPDSPNIDGYEISVAAVVDGNLRVMGTRDGDQANNSSYITMEGLEELIGIIDKRVAEVENIRDFDAVALHESNYQAFALAASALKSKVTEPNTLYDNIIAIGDMPPTVEHLEEWASEQMDLLRRGDADSVRVNELSNGKYRKFLSAVSAYLPEEDVKRLIDGIAAQRNTYSENHIIDQYDKVISHYQVHAPEGALADDVVSLLAAKDGVALMNWVRDSHNHDHSEPLQQLKAMLSTKTVYQADQITAAIQERDLQVDHRAQVERSLPKTPIEQSYAFVMGYYINNVSKMSEDEKALFKRLDSAHSVDAYQRWASDVRVGGVLQGLSDMPEAIRADVLALANQIIETKDDVLKDEVIDALDGIGSVNQFRKDALAQQYDALKAQYPDETILFRNGQGFSVYGADVNTIQDQTGWLGQTVGDKGQQFRWLNINHDGYNVLSDKELNLRVVTPTISIRPLASQWKDEMGASLQTIDYSLSLGGEKPVLIDTDGSLVISDKDSDFKVKTLDFHSTGLTAISEEGKEMVIRDIPKNYYHPQGTLVVADYINGHRQTIEHSLEASRPVSAEIQAKQTQLLASYKDVKAAHENEAVLFRQKGFLEAFGQDADRVAEKFGVPVYERNIGGEDVHFVMIPTEKYASALEDGIDLDLFIAKAQIDESRRDIRSTVSLNEQINVEHGRTKLGVSVMPIGDEGRYEIAIFDPDTKLRYDDAIELSKDDAEKFRSLEGMEHLSERSDLVMALADKYFSKELEMSDARNQVTKTYDNMGMSYTPLMLLQTIDFKPNQTAEVEHYNAVSVDPPYIMLYETMGDAEKSMSPRMLTDLPLDLQQSVLEQLKGGMFSEMQQEVAEHFEQPQEQHINIDDQLEHVGQLTKELGLEYVPFSIRLPITVPADKEVDWREEDKVFTEVMCNGDNVTIYQNHQDSYDDNNGVDLYDLPKDLLKEVLDLMEEKLTDGDRQMTVYVDTAQVPEYAVGSIVNGDNTGLTDESIEMVREFTSQYPNHIFSVRDNSTSFNSSPAFGKATDCVDVDIVRIATPKQLRQEVVDKQTEKLQERFNDFVKEHGEEPLYAEVTIRFKDDNVQEVAMIKLSEEVDPATDDKIFFNVDNFEGLKDLLKVDNGEDFDVIDIEDTQFYAKSLYQTQDKYIAFGQEVPQETIDELKADGVTDFSTENLEKLLHFEAQDNDVLTNDVNFDELPYHISYGDDPTGVIEGDVHVQFTKELAYVSFEDFKHYAEDLGGSVRMMNNERWADFFRQDDAEKFANTVVDVNVSRMEAARAGAKDQVKSEIMNLLPNSGIDFVMNRGSELVIPFGDNKEAHISDVFCKDDIQLTGFVVDNTNMEKSPVRSFDELSAPVQLALFNEIKKTLSQIEVKKDDVLAEVKEKISQTENKEYSPDDVAILKEAAIAHIEKYNSDYYQAKGVDIKGMIEGSEVTDRHSLSVAVASVVFDIHSEAIGRESGILERLLPNDMSRADETFMQSRDASAAAEAILDLRQNNLKDALDTKVAEVNTTLTEYNRLSQAADPSFMLHSHVEKYALEQQSENEFALTDPVERKFATSWMGARELLAHLASLLQKMFEKFPELKPSHEDKVEESAEEHVDAEEQAHAEKSDGQKKTSKWDNLDYTKYVLPEGADVTHKRWKFIKPKEGEQYGKYHIMCDFKGKHYEREMYGNDIKAFFEKDETGQRTNRVTLDQLVAKYFGKQFAESMSIGSVQEAEHVLAEQKDAKDQAVADKENQAAQREAAEEKKAAEEAAKKKAEEEKKAEKKEKVPTLILQSSLLVGALLAAKENGGVWLNKDGKAAPVLHQSGTPTVSAFNGLMMALHSDAHGYKSNDYTTFNAAKADGYHVKGGENGLPFNWYKWDKYVNRFNANEVIDKAAYDALAPEEKELYKVQRIKEERSIFNIDQTTMPEVKKDAYGFILEAQEKDSVYRGAEESAVQPVSLPKQFLELKEKHPDAILLMRDGNSYNLYGDDADKLAGLLGLEVKDHDPEGNEIKFAAFPHHALDINLPKMIRAGHRVAICDQIGDIRSSQRHGAADAIYNKAVALEDALVKLSGNTNKVMKEPFFDTAYDGKEDTLRFADRRYYRPGNEIVTALQRVNDSFRAAAAYTGGESRLNRVAYSTMLPGDTEKYDRLISELAAGVLMSRAGLPATLSKESMALVPYWERELKESPKLMESVERDVNNAVEVLEKIKAGETVDYAAIRGEKAFDAVRPKLYTIANELATIPNADTKIVVVVKDQQNKSAAVILPAGASLEVNNEITGLNKNRFLIALRKQGFENVQFYNAGGALGLNQSNEFFADKTVEVAKLKQYDLQVVENIDLSEEIERSLKVDLEQVQVTFDDNMHAVLYVKPVDGESFTVYPEPSDVKLFFDNVRSPEFDSIRENLGQKYYGLVARHPDLKTDVLMPKVSADLDLSRISKVNITKDRYKPESTIIFATIDGQQQKPIELSQIEAQRYWLVDDKNLYKLLVAAQKFEEQLHVDNGQSEGGQGQFHDSHEGSGVDSSSPSAEVSAEEDKQERKGGIRM